MTRLLILIALIISVTIPTYADSPSFFRYQFQAGDSFIVDVEVDNTVQISGNERNTRTRLKEKMTILAADPEGYTVRIVSLGPIDKKNDLDDILHPYDLLAHDEVAEVIINRRGRFKKWLKEPFGGYTPPYLPLLPLKAIIPGEKREQRIRIKTGDETHSTTFDKWARLNGRKVASFNREVHGRTFTRELEYHTWDKYALDTGRGYTVRGEVKHQSQFQNSRGVRTEIITYVNWTLKPERKSQPRSTDTW